MKFSTKAPSKNKFPEFGWRWNWSSGSDGVVPRWADDVMLDVESLHLGVADLHSDGVVAGLELGVHHQTGGRGSATDESQKRVPGAQGNTRPVATDLAEESMLDRVPFGQGVMMPVSRSASYVVSEYA